MIYRFFAALFRMIAGVILVTVAGFIAWKLAFQAPTMNLRWPGGSTAEGEQSQESGPLAATDDAAQVAKFASGWLSRSDQVRFAQAMLQELSLDPGPIDGLQGGKTRAAIRAFQAEQGIVETGNIDQALLQELAGAVITQGEDPMKILRTVKQ